MVLYVQYCTRPRLENNSSHIILTLPRKRRLLPHSKISPTHELSAQIFKLFFFYRFCEDICNLFFGINRVDHNSFVVYKLSEVMVFESNVFRPWGKLRRLSNFDAAPVILPSCTNHFGRRVTDRKKSTDFFHEIEKG